MSVPHPVSNVMMVVCTPAGTEAVGTVTTGEKSTHVLTLGIVKPGRYVEPLTVPLVPGSPFVPPTGTMVRNPRLLVSWVNVVLSVTNTWMMSPTAQSRSCNSELRT